MKITLDLTKEQALIIRDSLMMRVDKERQYRHDMKRFHDADSIKNLLRLSKEQEDKVYRLGDLFHEKLVLTKWQD